MPKGVVVTHRGLDELRRGAAERYAYRPTSRALHFSSPSFDASVLETAGRSPSGATMVIAPPTVYGGDGTRRAAPPRAASPTRSSPRPRWRPSTPPGSTCSHAVVVGGEACPAGTGGPLGARPRRMYNGYGPTETTIMTQPSATDWRRASRSPIGGPVRGVAEVDPRLAAAAGPVGVAGELYLAGRSWPAATTHAPALTGERFVANPFGEPGDADVPHRRPRALAAGRHTVEYLGRTDFQVKIRGFRIELGEIDAALAAHPDVDVRGDRRRGTGPPATPCSCPTCCPTTAPAVDAAGR